MNNPVPPFQNPQVAAVFQGFPEPSRSGLLKLRQLIFQTAAEIPEVGALEETLKWGQPSYLTPQTKSGSTLRLGVPKEGGFGIYVHCQTTLMSTFQDMFPNEFDIEGNRAIRFRDAEDLAVDKLRLLVSAALTYHSRKRR